MDQKLYLFLFSLSILLPAIIGLIRYKNANKSYRPFLWYIFISLLNELFVGLYLVNMSKVAQTADWNLFNLLECLIFLTQLYYWQLFANNKKVFFGITGALLILWLWENFIRSNILSFNYIFLITYSLALAVFSIYAINTIVLKLNSSLFKSSTFIICVGWIIYSIYTIIVFTFLLVGTDKHIKQEVFAIKVYINALVNVLYAAAVYFIPRETKKVDYFEEISRRNIKQY